MKLIKWAATGIAAVAAAFVFSVLPAYAGIGLGDENLTFPSLAAAGADNEINRRTGATDMDSSMFSGRSGANPGTDRGISRDFDNRGIAEDREFDGGSINRLEVPSPAKPYRQYR